MILPPTAGIIGWPVAQSKSPRIHRFWLETLGIDGDYGRFPVDPDRLAAAIRALPALGLRGVNVTMPHKLAVMNLLDELDPSALAVGAVNTVRLVDDRLIGANTDVDGIGEPLAPFDLAGHEAIVVGAGGAARAALAALKRCEIGRVTIINRNADTAAALLRTMAVPGTVVAYGAPLPPAALVINASSLGMAGSPPLDLDLSSLPGDAVVFDAVYAPLDTALLRAARERGLRTIDGLSMLIAQAAAAFAMFFDAAAPREHDAELRARLTA